MSATTLDILLVLTGALGLMIAFTLAGEGLRARQPPGESSPAVEAFVARVRSWWAILILLSLAVLTGPVAVVLLFAFASFSALREFLTYATKRRADHLTLALAAFVVLPLHYVFVGMGWTGLFTVFIPVLCFLVLPVVSVLRGDPVRFLERVAETQWGLMICVYCLGHVPALMASGGERAVLLIVFLAMVVQLGDLVEYHAGRRVGRRRLAPGVSPKTLEGVAAGVAAAAAIGALLGWLTPWGMGGAAAMAALASVAGMSGSLVLAAIKRDKGVKDWSHLIPGQGGFLDQLDSVIFAAPAVYHAARLIWG